MASEWLGVHILVFEVGGGGLEWSIFSLGGGRVYWRARGWQVGSSWWSRVVLVVLEMVGPILVYVGGREGGLELFLLF